MMNEAFMYRFAFIVFALPTAWTCMIMACRYYLNVFNNTTRFTFAHQDRLEKIFLTLMVIPYASGLLVVSLRQFMPAFKYNASNVFPPLTDLIEDIIPGDITVFAQFGFDESWVIFLIVMLIIYGFGVGLGLLRLVRGWWQIKKIEASTKFFVSDAGHPLYITAELVSPFVNMQGKIIFPEALFEEFSHSHIEMIIQHERAHQRRGDPLYFWVLEWIDVIFWFNIFIRKQTKLCRLISEFDCDDAFVKENPDSHKLYAETMLTTLRKIGGNTPVKATDCVPTIFSNTTKGQFKMRISEIMRSNKNVTKPISTVAIMSMCMLSVFALSLTFAQFSASHYAHAMSGDAGINFTVTPLNADTGTKILAPGAGLVLRVLTDYKGYGNLLEIDHGAGYVTRYGQLSAFDVKVGDSVVAGQIIARVGESGRATGPHLHLELWKDGESIDPESMLPIHPLN